MKHTRTRSVWLALLAVLLCCAMLLASCTEKPNAPEEPSVTPDAGGETNANTGDEKPGTNGPGTETGGGNGNETGGGNAPTPPTGDFVMNGTFDGGTPSVQGWGAEYKLYNLAQNLDKFHMQGRTQAVSTGMTADWAASGFEFRADFKNAIYVVATSSAACQFAVFLNGTNVGVLSLRAGENLQYQLPISTSGENQVVRLVRMTRPVNAQTSFASVALDGEVKAWSDSERKLIEFVGDSITCGCGLVDPSLADYDASKSYAYQLANAMGCDYSMVSEGGIGVSASNSWHNGNTIGTLYGCTGFYRDPTVQYTPVKTADLVVVNLNTNDHGNNPTETAYKADAKELIQKIRTMHGADVKIVWVVGHMIDSTATVNTWLADVYSELGGENAGLYTITVTKDNAGGASHPSLASHTAVAQALQSYITANNLLG
ncbi:MAG: SGNH/GDSL hydrolase family protein [Clostridia bacterium]|nr:SGNH/GDSL hydrolase family protein [Clostridia bacterium]